MYNLDVACEKEFSLEGDRSTAAPKLAVTFLQRNPTSCIPSKWKRSKVTFGISLHRGRPQKVSQVHAIFDKLTVGVSAH